MYESNHKENKSTLQCTVHLYSLLINYLMADWWVGGGMRPNTATSRSLLLLLLLRPCQLFVITCDVDWMFLLGRLIITIVIQFIFAADWELYNYSTSRQKKKKHLCQQSLPSLICFFSFLRGYGRYPESSEARGGWQYDRLHPDPQWRT